MISVHVRPSAESKHKDIAKFVIDCELDGSITRYPLHLRASHSESSEMPFPSKQRPLGQTLDTWLKAVSVPVVIVKPQPIINAGVKHLRTDSIGSSNNWSGFVLSGIDFFEQAYGQWTVPWIPFAEQGNFTASSIWVGIDGYSSGDLIQTGTEQTSGSWYDFCFFNYYAWTEVLPSQQYEVVQSNLPVGPGDQMFAVALLDFLSATGALLLQNSTTNEAILVQVPVGAFTPGFSAEWIMERPLRDESFTDLSMYLLAIMSGAFAVTGPPIPSGAISYNGSIIYYSTPSIHSIDNV